MVTRDWLTLVHATGLNATAVRVLIEGQTGDGNPASQALDLLSAAGLKDHTRNSIEKPDESDLARDLSWLEDPNNHLVPATDPRYPKLLKEIPDPPVALFVRGDPDMLGMPQLAIVGSRNPTSGGAANAYDFARHLAGCGLIITSGLARGIDTQSHTGALADGGVTIAVCATGLDSVYPKQNEELASRIAESGALVSEFPPGTRPLRNLFPQRNRIISGLSLGTLVVEAAQRSGSLITARHALDQGREVFAIPGSIHNPIAKGCHRLIRQGAKLVDSATHILEELGPLAATLISAEPSKSTVRGGISTDFSDDPEYAKLLQALGYDPVPLDALKDSTGLTAEQLSSMLLILELEGVVESSPGGAYSRVIKEAEKQ